MWLFQVASRYLWCVQWSWASMVFKVLNIFRQRNIFYFNYCHNDLGTDVPWWSPTPPQENVAYLQSSRESAPVVWLCSRSKDFQGYNLGFISHVWPAKSLNNIETRDTDGVCRDLRHQLCFPNSFFCPVIGFQDSWPESVTAFISNNKS